MSIVISILMLVILGYSYNDENSKFWRAFYGTFIIYFLIVLYGAIRNQII